MLCKSRNASLVNIKKKKLKNILLELEYDGTNYKGWQIQRGKSRHLKQITIQETLEDVLGKILRQKVTLIGSGRTDAGVHAKSQYANFKTSSFLTLDKLKKALNSLLPKDIRVKSIKEVNIKFHARYAAKSKTYRYAILNRDFNSAFLHRYIFHVIKPLDLKLMQQESKVLLGQHDFRSFQATDKKKDNSIRTIKKITFKKRNKMIYIDIEADGFLYNMVRNIVGTLIEIGRGKVSPGSLRRVLKAKDRKLAGPTAPAKGLSLLRVNYK